MRVIDEKLMSVSEKQFPTPRTNNWNPLPLLFAFDTTELEGAYCTAHGTLIQIFPDSMLGWEPFVFQYLKNALSRDVDLLAYLRHCHKQIGKPKFSYLSSNNRFR
jgi:hypothetical protein